MVETANGHYGTTDHKPVFLDHSYSSDRETHFTVSQCRGRVEHEVRNQSRKTDGMANKYESAGFIFLQGS